MHPPSESKRVTFGMTQKSRLRSAPHSQGCHSARKIWTFKSPALGDNRYNIFKHGLKLSGRLKMLRGLPFTNEAGSWLGHLTSSSGSSGPAGWTSVSWVTSGPSGFTLSSSNEAAISGAPIACMKWVRNVCIRGKWWMLDTTWLHTLLDTHLRIKLLYKLTQEYHHN